MNLTIDPRSSRHHPVRRFVAVVVVVGGLVGTALAHEVGDTVMIDAPVRDDLYAAGRLVTVRSDIDGDLTVAGQSVSILGIVTGDVMATGETVMLAGPLRDDVRVVGRTVLLSGEIGDHAIAAGEVVMVAKSARVGSFAWLAGRRVEIDGEIVGDLDVAAETVVISGLVGGSVRADATNLVIEASARIGGDVSWPAGQVPSIHDDAHIGGRSFERPGEPSPMRGPGAWLGGIVFNTLTLLVLTGALGWVLRPLMRGAAAIVHSRPGPAVGAGLLALIAAPLTGIVALVTVIGAPVGLAVLLGYVLLLIFSVPTALLSAAEYALHRRGGWGSAPVIWRLGALALVSLLFVLLLELPVVRVLVGLAAVLVGLGALVLRLRAKPPT